MSRQQIVAGNWKLNGSKALINAFNEHFTHTDIPNVSIMLFVPALYAEAVDKSAFCVGVQNISEHSSGAHTGELSVAMLNDLGIKYTLVGHSERRQMYGDSNAVVAKKVSVALDADITPILCVGESLETCDAGQLNEFIQAQLDSVIELVGIAGLSRCVVAYEPIWAIGTGHTATPEQAQAVHAFIRQYIASKDAMSAQQISILYGGSVNAQTASDLFAQPDIDGGLVGGASLQQADFLTICQAANQRG